jgi:hypothetical protein
MSIGTDLALALDPVRLADRAGIKCDPWQAELLRARAKQMILLCSRQTGKSTVTSILALHEALYHAPALVLLLSPSLRQSQELFRKVKDALAALNTSPTEIEEESALKLELANGSRIVCLPGKEATIRGFSGVALLVVDEASRVDDSLYASIRPMLAVSGGRLILLSTPFGKRGFFYKEWSEGGQNWHRAKIAAEECPRISLEFLGEERRAMGTWWYSQEYECQFVDTIDQIFRGEDIEAAVTNEVEPLNWWSS